MGDGYVEIPLSPDDPARYDKVAALARAIYYNERLAGYRRVLIVVLAVLGVPLAVVSRLDHSARGLALSIIVVIWFGTAATIVRLLWLEHRNRKTIETLLARTSAPRDRSPGL